MYSQLSIVIVEIPNGVSLRRIFFDTLVGDMRWLSSSSLDGPQENSVNNSRVAVIRVILLFFMIICVYGICVFYGHQVQGADLLLNMGYHFHRNFLDLPDRYPI